MAIHSLCITESADRPTVAPFVGMHNAGNEDTVRKTIALYEELIPIGERQ